MAFSAVTILMLAVPAQANSITNGSFELTPGHSSSFEIPTGPSTTDVTGWTSTKSSLNCLVFLSGNPGDPCGIIALNSGAAFWPGPTASPDGGNFVAVDGDPTYAGVLSQTVTGLVPFTPYNVFFYQAATQFRCCNGATTERWRVSLGSETHDSAIMNNASKGFVSWMSQSLTFTPQNTTEVLSFFAVGTPNGLPPIVLLDGVVLNPAPEPATYAIMGLGLAGILTIRKVSNRG